MGVRASKLTGSGGIVPESEIGYSYSEDVTSLEPSEISGGNGQVSLTAIASDPVANFRAHTRLTINNEMEIVDDARGSIDFRVKKVNVNNRVASLTGETIEGRMNVERTAEPVGGTGDTLKTAIDYYCGLVDVVPTYTAELLTHIENKPVNFMGWQGNVWEHLKMLCAAVSASATTSVPMEMVVDVDTLNFRIALQSEVDLVSDASNLSVEVDSFDAAQEVSVNLYETRYAENEVINEDNPSNEFTGFVKGVSITDQLQVDAGEVLVKRFQIDASLQSVNQPTPVATITSVPYTGTTGEYVVVGVDDLPIMPTQWIAEGGKLEVSLTENPNEIEVRVTAPQATQLQQAGDPSAFTLAPYKIGVESSGGTTYPALYITGTGVFFERKTVKFLTGANPEFAPEQDGSLIDNPFMTNKNDLSIRGVAAAQRICGPSVKLSVDNPKVGTFSQTVGSLVQHSNNQYRIESASYTHSSNSYEGRSYVRFSKFDSIWTGKTFSDFSAIMDTPASSPDDYITFNEFSSVPLNEDI